MFDTLVVESVVAQQSFSWTNLIIFAVVAAVVIPLLSRLRASLTRRRRERWAQEEGGTRKGADHSPDGGRNP